MAMVQLAQNIPVPNAIGNIVKWEVLEAADRFRDAIPHLDVTIRCCGSGSGDSNPYCDKTLVIYDSQASGVLTVNAASASYTDAITVIQTSVTGNPYTTLSGVFNANVSGAGTIAKRIAALQAAIAASAGTASGVVSAAFAGT